jgi:hypothetical protein
MGCAFAWPIDETGCNWPLIAASVPVPTSPSSHKAGLATTPAAAMMSRLVRTRPWAVIPFPGDTTGPRGFQGLVGP